MVGIANPGVEEHAMEVAAVSARNFPTTAASAAPAQSAQAVADAQAAKQALAAAERERSTVNARGQTVGTRVNTTA